MTELATCRSCKAPVRWLRIIGGSRMPVDHDPDAARGNIVRVGYDLDGNELGRVLSETEASDGRADGQELYLSHFATCPDAPSWRR